MMMKYERGKMKRINQKRSRSLPQEKETEKRNKKNRKNKMQ